jgi:3'-phosphoadenosine 5'-phosphosulfate sulfotransferase (PAPS reductase)/FAD synthetase
MQLGSYDFIVINSSAGKDSQAMTDVICQQAKDEGVLARVLMVHADLGRVEWQGTKELAEEHARHYGISFVVVKRTTPRDLLVEVQHRGKWPSSTTRYCTSYYKRDAVLKLFTQLSRGRERTHILNCLGFRSEESPARAKRIAFALNERATTSSRITHDWLPIHTWTTEQVWERIRQAGTRAHPAYALGMPRLSCCFCIFAPKSALMLAGKHNPQLLDEYVKVEQEIGHRFRKELSLLEVQQELQAGVEPGPVRTWAMS